MKKKKYQATDERAVLTGMVANDDVLDTVARNLKGETKPFRSKWSNLICKWCLEYWAKYKRSPKGLIQNRFVRYAESNQDEDTIALVETFLKGLSDDMESISQEMNSQFVIDTASRYFNEIRLERLAKKITQSLEAKDTEAANEAYREFELVEFVSGQHPDFFDVEQQKKWLAGSDNETLITFPGALGEFMGRAFERDAFVAFAGPEKRGKSYWLMEVVWQALRQRRRVLYYVVGDMSERQTMIRLMCRATRRPRWKESVVIPIAIVEKKDKIFVAKKVEEREGLNSKVVSLATKKLMMKTATKEPRLKTRVYESSTLSASDIESEVADLAKEDWVPDVVVIDYADILSAESHSKQMEYRHQVNESWKTLRRISQRFHLCLVTATQTAATSYDATLIRKGDFSEDKRKAAHVTAMVGLNQTSEEKRNGLYRLNWIFLREGHWSDNQVVYAAGNLAIGCPCIISSLF